MAKNLYQSKNSNYFLSLELSCDNEAIVNNFSFVIEVIGKKEHKVAAKVVSAVGVVQQYLKQWITKLLSKIDLDFDFYYVWVQFLHWTLILTLINNINMLRMIACFYYKLKKIFSFKQVFKLCNIQNH